MHKRNKRLIWLLVCMCLSLPSVAQAFGIVSGSLSFKPPDTSSQPAGWVRILLVRSPVTVPAVPGLGAMNPPERMETIRNLHMAFFISVREALADPDFVVRSGLTTPQGFFEFPEVPAGKYHLVVTFPAMVRDYKLAWQIPVTVMDDETCRVVLNNDNLLLPTYSRSHPSRLNLERD